MTTQPPRYRGYRFPPDIISYAVWLYHRFVLSFRDVEDLLAERGVTVTYEAIRQWCLTFGLDYARRLRRRRGRQGDTWYLDEVFVKIQAGSSLSGEPWTKTAMSSTSSSSRDAIGAQPHGSSGSC